MWDIHTVIAAISAARNPPRRRYRRRAPSGRAGYPTPMSGDMDVEDLKPSANDTLQRWPVSKRVNSSKADKDDATLIERVGHSHPTAESDDLFASP